MKPRIPASLITTALLFLVVMAAYIAAYWYMPDHLTGDQFNPKYLIRVYPHKWQVVVFQPAGRLDALFTGREIIVDKVSTVDAEP